MPETAFAAKVSMTASGDRDSDAPSGTASVPLRDHSKSDAAATEPAVSAEYMQEIARRKGHAERMAAQAEEILRVLSDECSQEDIARAVSEAVRGEEETPPWELAQRSANELSVAECRTRYVAKFLPLLLSDVSDLTEPDPWTMSWLVETYGTRESMPCRRSDGAWYSAFGDSVFMQ
uniref:Uncharacterized protein n=1 Tax=Chrysotila carterae TaxID=13221 RepID=A0A7S4B1F6_CHRCT